MLIHLTAKTILKTKCVVVDSMGPTSGVGPIGSTAGVIRRLLAWGVGSTLNVNYQVAPHILSNSLDENGRICFILESLTKNHSEDHMCVFVSV